MTHPVPDLCVDTLWEWNNQSGMHHTYVRNYCTTHSNPVLILLHKETPRQCRFQARVLVQRMEFTIFTYSQFPLQKPDTQYHLMDTTASEEGFRKKTRRHQCVRGLGPNTEGANTEGQTVCTEFHLRFKGIFSTQNHICMCNITLCILVYHGTGVWSNS